MDNFIPVNTPLLDGNEKKYLLECIETGWISSEGPFVNRFEKQFSRSVGRKYAVAVCNGSAALDTAVAALEIGAGDEVILPSFTIISCATAVVRAGAVPVVVDCDPITWNMDTDQIEQHITARTKAIMAVHIYGLPVDMEPVLSLARKYGLRVIEDAAEAHGLSCRGNPCGSFGDLSTFSFYPNKLVTTGEGGMLLTDDEAVAERCRSLRNLCFRTDRRFLHHELGWNYRMSNLQAAVGLAQLERMNEFIGRKRRMGRRYTELLSDIPGIQLPCAHTGYAENIYWVYGIVLKKAASCSAAEVMRQLSLCGVGTRPFFFPMHRQPVFIKTGLFKNVSCPTAERIAQQGFYIPSGLALSNEQIERVSRCVKKVLT